MGIDGRFEYSDTLEAVVAVRLPVELTSFEALAAEKDIHLRWTTASELNNAGFSVEMRTAEVEFEEVMFVEGHGTTNTEQVYETTLAGVAAGDYFLRLKQIDFDGTFDYSSVVDVSVGSPAYHLAPSYPNPFNPQTQIPYTLPVNSHVMLEVFDLLGRKITTLVDEEQFAGSHTVLFDAADLPNGTYVYRITAGPYTKTRSMVLLK